MYQLVHPTLLQSIAFRLWQIYLPKIVRQCGQLSSSPTGSAADLWWAMMIGWVMWVMKVNQNVKKAPLSHQKMKNSFLYYVQLLMIGQVIPATKVDWNAKKGPLSHQKMKCLVLDYAQLLMIIRAIRATKFDWNVEKGPLSHHKMKCSFLDYVQLLMIGWAIRAMKVDWNVAKCPLSHRTMKCSFLGYIQLVMIGLAIWAKNIDGNAKKMKKAPKSLKNEMFIFGLRSTSDDRLSDPSKKHRPKHKKKQKRPPRHWKIKCSFLDYVQLLMISWVIQAKNVDWNAKKWKRPPKSLKNKMFVFGLCSISDDQLSDPSKKCWLKCKKMKKAP